jgi:hypothetical protein
VSRGRSRSVPAPLAPWGCMAVQCVQAEGHIEGHELVHGVGRHRMGAWRGDRAGAMEAVHVSRGWHAMHGSMCGARVSRLPSPVVHAQGIRCMDIKASFQYSNRSRIKHSRLQAESAGTDDPSLWFA